MASSASASSGWTPTIMPSSASSWATPTRCPTPRSRPRSRENFSSRFSSSTICASRWTRTRPWGTFTGSWSWRRSSTSYHLGSKGVRGAFLSRLIYHYGETVIPKRERQAREAAYGTHQLFNEAVVGRWRTPSVNCRPSHLSMALFFAPHFGRFSSLQLSGYGPGLTVRPGFFLFSSSTMARSKT